MQAENKDKDMEGCTFSPEIYSVEEGYQKRNLEQFLEDQQNFVTKVTKKIEDEKMRASMMEDNAMHPQIDEQSRRIVEEKLAEKRGNRPIHERLYDLNKELQDKKKQMSEIENNKFKSQQSVMEQSIQKRDNLDKILYEDAERRRKDQAKAKELLDRVRDTPSGKPYHNDKSDRYV